MPTDLLDAQGGGWLRATRSGWQTVERGFAGLAVGLLALRTSVGPGLDAGIVVVMILLPVWVPAMTRTRAGRLLFGLGILAILCGVVLSAISSGNHLIDSKLLERTTLLMFGCLGGVGVLAWAIPLLSVRTAALCYGSGMLVDASMVYRIAPTDNPLKYIWGIPLAVVILALFAGSTKSKSQVVTLAALAALFAVSDTRSYFATALLALALVVWQMRPAGLKRRSSWAWTATLMTAMAGGAYFLGTTLLVDGFLGQAAQQRSIQQINEAGSLILGGRPELAATWALIRDRPFGFGPGVQANVADIDVAKAGMASINYDPNNGYVEKFMFGDGIELHSVTGDLWAHFGVLGLCLSLFIILLTLRSVAILVSRRQASGLVLLIGIFTVWSLFFSPFYSTVPLITLLLGLLLASTPGASGVGANAVNARFRPVRSTASADVSPEGDSPRVLPPGKDRVR